MNRLEAELDPAEFCAVASGSYLEGLTIDHDRGIVWYSDVIGGGIHALRPDGTIESFHGDRVWIAGLLVNADGSVLSGGPGGIMWTNPETARSGWLLDTIDGNPINGVNEMAPDGSGGIYFGTLDVDMLSLGEPTRPTGIFRLTADLTVITVADELGFANGIALSADGRRLYCNDTFTGTWVFDVRSDFSLHNKRLLVAKEDADGLAVDTRDNLWITGFRSNHLDLTGRDGAPGPRIPIPAAAASQIRFGGLDMRDCYLTTVAADAGDTVKNGKPIPADASVLYRGRSSIPGLKTVATKFVVG